MKIKVEMLAKCQGRANKTSRKRFWNSVKEAF